MFSANIQTKFFAFCKFPDQDCFFSAKKLQSKVSYFLQISRASFFFGFLQIISRASFF